MPPDFLVVGLQKSGTYWVTNLLNSHADITCFPTEPAGGRRVKEGHFFTRLALLREETVSPRDVVWQEGSAKFPDVMSCMHNGFFSHLVPLTGRVQAPALLDLYCRRFNAWVQLQRRPGSRIVGEKTPNYVFVLDLIEDLYPGIRKICILREPCDRVLSFYHHQVRKGHLAPPSGSVSDEFASSYCDRMELEYSRLLDFRGSLHLLSYEELSADADIVLGRVLDYLDVDSSQATVDRMVASSSFERLAGRARGSMEEGSHYRKGTSGDGHQYLPLATAARLHERLDLLTERLSIRYQVSLNHHLAT